MNVCLLTALSAALIGGFSRRQVMLINAVFLQYFCPHLLQVLLGFGARHNHMSLAAQCPIRWNICFHFEVEAPLNHLAGKDAGKDAGRRVKLLCLAAGSPSANRTQERSAAIIIIIIIISEQRDGERPLLPVVFSFSHLESRWDVSDKRTLNAKRFHGDF